MTALCKMTGKISEWTNQFQCPTNVNKFCEQEKEAFYGALGGFVGGLVTRVRGVSGAAFGFISGTFEPRVYHAIRKICPECTSKHGDTLKVFCAKLTSTLIATFTLRAMGTSMSPFEVFVISSLVQLGSASLPRYN